MTDSIEITTVDAIETLQIVCDSLANLTPYIQEIANNSQPEPYTIQNLFLTKWNLIVAISAAIFGALGAIFGYYGYKYAKSTANSVTRINSTTQMALCYDFINDMWMNLIRTIILIKHDLSGKFCPPDKIAELYISQFSDIFHTEVFIQSTDIHIDMKRIKDKMRHYEDTLKHYHDYTNQHHLSPYDRYNLLWGPIHILTLTQRLTNNLHPIQKENAIFIFLWNKHTAHVALNAKYLKSQWENQNFMEVMQAYQNTFSQYRFIYRLYSIIDENSKRCLNPLKHYPERFEILQSLFSASPDKEYSAPALKDEWTKEDMKQLIIKMLVYDALLEDR